MATSNNDQQIRTTYWASKGLWWVGTLALLVGLWAVAQTEPTPGLFAAALIVPLLAWGSARAFRIHDLESRLEELEEESDED